MIINELSDERLRELADLEDAYDVTVCNPHLGLEPISLRQLAEEQIAKEAKAARVQKPTPKIGSRRKAA